MTYLGSLLAQADGATTPLRPLLPARFEPAAPTEGVAERAAAPRAQAAQPSSSPSPAPPRAPAAAKAASSVRGLRPGAAPRAETAEGPLPVHPEARTHDPSAVARGTPPVVTRPDDRAEPAPAPPWPRVEATVHAGAAFRRGDTEARVPAPAATPSAPATATPATSATPPTVVEAPPVPPLRSAEAGSPVRRRGREDRDAGPSVRVSIGRVELRTPPAARPAAAPAPRQPRLSLDDYLRERSR